MIALSLWRPRQTRRLDGAPFQIAQVYALRNDARRPLPGSTGRGAAEMGESITSCTTPFIRRYKDDPRFAAFCRKVGLPTPAEIGKRT
jgi:hypothetical protein